MPIFLRSLSSNALNGNRKNPKKEKEADLCFIHPIKYFSEKNHHLDLPFGSWAVYPG
jgi:hypothetical protein